MARSLTTALILAMAPLAPIAAQTAPAQGQAAPAPMAQPGMPPDGAAGAMMGQGHMTGMPMGPGHAMMTDGRSCACPCMTQEPGDPAKGDRPPHDHRREHEQP